MAKTFKGIVAKIDHDGFGFIARGMEQVFFHHSAVERVSFGQLELGRAVEYELADGPCPLHDGPHAVAVRPI